MSQIYKKTVRYNLSPTHNPSDLSDNVPAVVGTGSIYIAENTPTTPVRVTDVMFYSTLQDTSTVTGATVAQTTTYVSASMNGSVYSRLFVLPSTLSNSGENWSYTLGPMDGRSLFNSGFGQSETSSISIVKNVDISSGTGTNTRAVYCWVDVTYEYSASAAYRTHTIAIPLASIASLPASLATQYTIPQLSGSGGLLEDYGDLSIKSAWVELKGSDHNPNSATNQTISFSWDAGVTGSFPTRINALATTKFERYIIPYNKTVTAAHTLQLACTTTNRYRNIGGLFYITFTYNPSTTTRILNYVTLPVDLVSPLKSSAQGPNEYVTYVDIQEPGPISNHAVSLELFNTFNADANINLKWDVSASYTSITQVGSGNVAGPYWIMHPRGTGAGLTRGLNKLAFKAYSTTANSGTNMSGLIHVLYESSVPSGSIDNATHLIKSMIGRLDGAQYNNTRLFSGSINIPPVHYSNISSGIELHTWSGTSGMTYVLTVQRLTNEGSGSWIEVYSDVSVCDPENGSFWVHADTCNVFVGHREEYSTRVDITQARNYWFSAGTGASRPGAIIFANIHHITGSVSGTITGIQTTATASLHRADTHLIQQIQYISGSSFTFPVYSDTLQYYVNVYESNTYKGRSKIDFPGTGFDVNLSGTSNTEHSYTFVG